MSLTQKWHSNLGAPPVGSWIHVVATFQQYGESYVYLDGRQSNCASSNTSNRPSGGRTELWLGRPHHGGHWCDCWVKSVQVFNYALQASEVQAIYAAGV